MAKAPKHLITRNGLYSYYRRVPRMFRDVDPRTNVIIALGTRDVGQAVRLRDFHDRQLAALWVSLKKGGSEDARERYRGAIERARLEGFEYHTAVDLATGDVAELLTMLERLEAVHPSAGESDDAGNRTEEALAEALVGTAKMPGLTLSGAADEFFDLTRDLVRRKSPDQVRRWRAPRLKAMRNLETVLGDKVVSTVTRADGNAFRAWWLERVLEDGYTPNSANKDIGHVAQILDTLNERLELGMGRPFAGLRIKDSGQNRRSAFTVEQLVAIATEPRHLASLNAEARGIVLTMVETGMRPIEVCNLRPEDIDLAADVPHLRIRPGEDRELKTLYSRRDIPLVGISLTAIRENPEGFPRYRDKSSSLSALVNKILKSRGLLPSDDHSLYSIRHTFKDRLVAADMQDRLQDELMGHKSPRPTYGEGPTLAHKREWLLRISITPTPEANPDQMALI